MIVASCWAILSAGEAGRVSVVAVFGIGLVSVVIGLGAFVVVMVSPCFVQTRWGQDRLAARAAAKSGHSKVISSSRPIPGRQPVAAAQVGWSARGRARERRYES